MCLLWQAGLWYVFVCFLCCLAYLGILILSNASGSNAGGSTIQIELLDSNTKC